MAQASKEKVDSINAIEYDFIVSNLEESIKIFSDNLDAAKELDYQFGIAKSQANLAIAYYLNEKYEKSTESYLNAISILEELDNKKELSLILGDFGYQLKRRDLEKANQYMRRAIQIAEKNNYSVILGKLYDNYGVVKEMEGNLDSALYNYNKSLGIKQTLDDSIGIPYSLNNIALSLTQQGKFNEALQKMKQSDAYRNNEDGDFGKAENKVIYGDIYNAMGRLDSAIEHYNNAIKLSRKNGFNYIARYAYQKLTDAYKALGDYRNALESLMIYTAYKDSVLNEEVQTKIAELEIDYETEKKDRLLTKSKLEISEKNSQLYLLGGLAAILIFFSIILYLSQKRKRERLVLQNKVKHAELENKLSAEKLRISRELHDNIGSQLTFMISSIDNYLYKNNEDADILNRIGDFGRDTLKDLRSTIWALKHEGAELDELILKVNEFVQNVNHGIGSTDICVSNNVKKKYSLSAAQMLNLFRIIQEAVQNVVKHSEATIIKVEFDETPHGFVINVSDNGNGIKEDISNQGNGLSNMKQRCEESNGKFNINGSDTGTKITCEIII